MLRSAAIMSVLVLALAGCSDGGSEPPDVPDVDELPAIDGPAEVDDDDGGAEVPG